MKKINNDEENIKMLLERLEDYKSEDSNKSNSEFGRGYDKGYNMALDDAIYLVKLYILNDFDE